jgi:hypothetical protein
LASSFINIFSNLSFLSALYFSSFLPSVLHSLVCCWQETADVVVFANFAETSTFVLRTAFFWVISHRLVVFLTDVSGQPIGPIPRLQESFCFLR